MTEGSVGVICYKILQHFTQQRKGWTVMIFPLCLLLTIVNVSSGLLVRHSNGSLVEFEKELVEEEVSPDLIIGSYQSQLPDNFGSYRSLLPENGKELSVSPGQKAGQYR